MIFGDFNWVKETYETRPSIIAIESYYSILINVIVTSHENPTVILNSFCFNNFQFLYY